MNTQEYFSQAYNLDQRINSKIEQIASLNELATKCTSAITGMPHSPNRGKTTMADTVTKIVALQEEINRDIDSLVDLKREMAGIIKMVESPEHQVLLELRYLCFKSWEQIAVEMGYSLHHLYKVHRTALDAAAKWIPNDTV